MLMDEPLAALDMKRKSEILPYLQRLNDELHIPILYVSHALDEVSALADLLVLLEKGKVVASGKTGEMLTRLDLPLAFYDTASAIIDGKVIAKDPEFCLNTLSFSGGFIQLPGERFKPGQTVRLRIQARDVSLATEKPAKHQHTEYSRKRRLSTCQTIQREKSWSNSMQKAHVYCRESRANPPVSSNWSKASLSTPR